jgi:hypothetical protein
MSRPKRKRKARLINLQAARGDALAQASREIRARVSEGEDTQELTLPPLPCDCEALRATLRRLQALKWG